MKLIKTASGKKQLKMSRREWESIGCKAGWMGNILGKMQSWFSGIIGQVFQNPKANFIASGINALQTLAQQSQNPQEQQMLNNLVTQLKTIQPSQSLSEMKSIIENAKQSLQSTATTPMQQTAGGGLPTAEKRRNRRRIMSPAQKAAEQRRKQMGEDISELTGAAANLVLQEINKASILANEKVLDIANQQVGGMSGATAISLVDQALQILSLALLPGLEGISTVFSQVSNYVSQTQTPV